MSAPASVALVLVSHSRELAQGAAELAAQMAPGVVILPAGGTPAGLGTSFDLISESLVEATDGGRAAVVLTDLGSAVLTTEAVLEFADEDVVARVRLADAPFVEGAVAAAVAAYGGADLEAVRAAAEGAGAVFAGAASAPRVASTDTGPVEDAAAGGAQRELTLRNPLGLHARPAAELARMVGGFDATVTINGVDAASVLELMKLGATGGQRLVVHADGPD
ncbi:MAG: dihydroxyacetone kinase phosphoryl donor subunit DhaM [Cellulomonas sp.]